MGLDRPAEPGRHNAKPAAPARRPSGTDTDTGTEKETALLRPPRVKEAASESLPRPRPSAQMACRWPSPVPVRCRRFPRRMLARRKKERERPRRPTLRPTSMFLTRRSCACAPVASHRQRAPRGHRPHQEREAYWIAVSRGGATQRELGRSASASRSPRWCACSIASSRKGSWSAALRRPIGAPRPSCSPRPRSPTLKAMSGTIDKLREDVPANIKPEEIAMPCRRARSDAGAARTP